MPHRLHSLVVSVASGLLALTLACGLHPAPRSGPIDYGRKENIKFSAETADPSTDSVWTESPSRLDEKQFERFRDEIQRFYKAPYVWGGASPAGTDCSGLVRTIFRRAADVNLPHSTLQLYNLGKSIRARDLRFGDLVFFRFNHTAAPDHVGMYISKHYFLHASVSLGVTLSCLTEAPYNDIYMGAKRILD